MDEPKEYGFTVRFSEDMTPVLDKVFRPSQLKGWRKCVMQVALLLVTGKWEKEVRVNP